MRPPSMQTAVAHAAAGNATLERFRLAAVKAPRQRQAIRPGGDQLLDQAGDRGRRIRVTIDQRGRTSA